MVAQPSLMGCAFSIPVCVHSNYSMYLFIYGVDRLKALFLTFPGPADKEAALRSRRPFYRRCESVEVFSCPDKNNLGGGDSVVKGDLTGERTTVKKENALMQKGNKGTDGEQHICGMFRFVSGISCLFKRFMPF